MTTNRQPTSNGLLLRLLLSVYLSRVVRSQSCSMTIWVFDTLEQCGDVTVPAVAQGRVFADGTCRTVETTTSPLDPAYHWLPGTYRAECTPSGRLRFIESGCISTTCSKRLAIDSVCERNYDWPSSLYSLHIPPEYRLGSDETTDRKCVRIQSGNVNVSFTAFGDCSVPSCNVGDETVNPTAAPSTASPSSPITAPPTPTPEPTNASTLVVSPTTSPTEFVTSAGTPTPTGPDPTTLSPSTTSPSDSPALSASPTSQQTVSNFPRTSSPTISRAPEVLQSENSDQGGLRFRVTSTIVVVVGSVCLLASILFWVYQKTRKENDEANLPMADPVSTSLEVGNVVAIVGETGEIPVRAIPPFPLEFKDQVRNIEEERIPPNNAKKASIPDDELEIST